MASYSAAVTGAIAGAIGGAVLAGPLAEATHGASTIIGIVLGLALGLTLGLFADRASRRRDTAFQALARRFGWVYRGPDDQSVLQAFAGYLPFSRGHSARSMRTLSGVHGGTEFHLMDGLYVTGSGKHRQTHRVSVVAVRTPALGSLRIVRETMGHKVADALGGEDIDFESAEFSRRFWVKAADRRFAYDVLHPRALEYLLAQGEAWTWHWEGAVLVLSRGGRLEPAQAVRVIETALGFIRLVPRHVVKDPIRQGWIPVPPSGNGVTFAPARRREST